MKSYANSIPSILARWTAIAITLLLLGSSIAPAQTRTIKLTGDQDIFMLKELGAVITDSEDGLSVMMVMPGDRRAKDFQDVDLREGDIIMMANGKKMKNVGQLEELYDSLSIGDEIKFGLKRGKDMMIESLTKADPDDLPGEIMMMKKGEDDGSVCTDLVEGGLLLKEDNGKFIVEDFIEQMADKITGPLPERGDVLLKIQGTPITKSVKISDIYSEIKTGEKVDLVLDRAGESINVSFTKQGCGGEKPLIIKKQGH
jgi:S1-C subfamily serine protease